MGLISFIKDAGAKIFGGKTSAEKAAEIAQAKNLAEAKERLIEELAAIKIKETIEQLELEVADLCVEIDDDKVTLHGEAANQATKEKVILVAGNSQGIATVDDQMTVATPEPEAQFYTVVRGDSLSKIAKEFYGNAMKYPVIFEANKPMLKDPNKIYPGQVLRIPPLDA